MKNVLFKRKKSDSFSFGENWSNFSKSIDSVRITNAAQDIDDWLGQNNVSGKTVLDIGSGSGMHGLAFHMLGAKKVVSFDADPLSVETTLTLRNHFGRSDSWSVKQGSILDAKFVNNLGVFDIVYAWGVLHHTGDLWEALDQASRLVLPGGKLWISIYTKGQYYQKHLNIKKKYNKSSRLGKKMMIFLSILRMMMKRMRRKQNPFLWNKKITTRGHDTYHDLIDWLGGLPYEVAGKDEIVSFISKRGFSLVKDQIKPEGACSVYMFKSE